MMVMLMITVHHCGDYILLVYWLQKNVEKYVLLPNPSPRMVFFPEKNVVTICSFGNQTTLNVDDTD